MNGSMRREGKAVSNVEESEQGPLTYALPELTAAPPMTGIRPAERTRSKVQWYEPWLLDPEWEGAASLTVPSRTAVIGSVNTREQHGG